MSTPEFSLLQRDSNYRSVFLSFLRTISIFFFFDNTLSILQASRCISRHKIERVEIHFPNNASTIVHLKWKAPKNLKDMIKDMICLHDLGHIMCA